MDGGITFPFNIVYTNLHKELESAECILIISSFLLHIINIG